MVVSFRLLFNTGVGFGLTLEGENKYLVHLRKKFRQSNLTKMETVTECRVTWAKRNFKISALHCITLISVVAELKIIAFQLHVEHVGTMGNACM